MDGVGVAYFHMSTDPQCEVELEDGLSMGRFWCGGYCA